MNLMIERSQRRTVFAIGAAQTLGWGSTYYLPAVLADSIAKDIGVSTSTVFGAFSLSLVVAAILGPFAGRQIDRLGGRLILMSSSVAFAVALVVLSVSSGPVTLFGAWIVIGVGMSIGLYEAAFSTLARLYRSGARSAITVVTLMAGFASTACWPISAHLDAEIGWRNVCLFWAILHVTVGLPLYWSLKDALQPEQQRQHEIKQTWQESDHVDRPAPASSMVLLAILFASTWFIATGMAAHLPRLLVELGATPSASMLAAALLGPAQVAGRLLEYFFLSRHHPLLSARLASLAHPVAAAALLLIGAPAAFAFAALHGFGVGILTIATGTLPLVMFGAHGYGLRQGLLMAPARCAQASAPFAFALLIDAWGVMSLIATLLLALLGLAALQLLAASART